MHKISRLIAVFILILLSTFRASAIDAVVSHTIFYITDPAHAGHLIPSLDAYWEVNPNTLHYKTNADKKLQGHIKTDIVFSNNTGIIASDHYILQTALLANVGEIMTHSIIELKHYSLPPGKVKMKLILTDLEDSVNHFTYADSFTINAATDTPFFSGVQLLDTTLASDAPTAFRKNGHTQVPRSSNFLDEKKHVIHYYTELYNTDHLVASNFPLTQKIIISKKQDGVYYLNYFKTDTITSPQKLSLISGSFPIAAMASGNYYITASLENSAHQQLASESYFFQRLNPHPYVEIDTTKKIKGVADTGIESVTVLNLSKIFLAKYSFNDIREILKMLIPFSDPAGVQTINNFLKKPDETYMRYYVYNYFLAIDKENPGHAWKEFAKKIVEVNKRFSAHGEHGYTTDRGIIFLKYGEPNDIVTVENEAGSLPYEVWQYDVLTQTNRKEISNAVFLFYKPFTYSNEYRLLHSTVGGETQNTSWRSLLYTSGDGGTNFNSRAEQYLGNR